MVYGHMVPITLAIIGFGATGLSCLIQMTKVYLTKGLPSPILLVVFMFAHIPSVRGRVFMLRVKLCAACFIRPMHFGSMCA